MQHPLDDNPGIDISDVYGIVSILIGHTIYLRYITIK